MVRAAALGVFAALGAAMPAGAAQIYSTGYDMINGGGQASGGGYNYWDLSYSGSGSTTTDGAYLSGGSGDLTDGYVPGVSYQFVENNAGTGPYVGWLWNAQPNPVITFHFAGMPNITGLSINLENTGTGGVYAPQKILIDGADTAFTAPSGVGWVNFTGLNLTGATHTLELQQYGGTWVFVSEVTFEGGAAPEPAAWTMMIAGFGLAGAALRRRRMAAA